MKRLSGIIWNMGICVKNKFFIHRKLRPMNEKAFQAGCAPLGEEVCCKQQE